MSSVDWSLESQAELEEAIIICPLSLASTHHVSPYRLLLIDNGCNLIFEVSKLILRKQ